MSLDEHARNGGRQPFGKTIHSDFPAGAAVKRGGRRESPGPCTVSQDLPGTGGVFQGHLASPLLPAFEPKSAPSRSGFTLTLMIVPGFIVSAVMPCSATAASARHLYAVGVRLAILALLQFAVCTQQIHMDFSMIRLGNKLVHNARQDQHLRLVVHRE